MVDYEEEVEEKEKIDYSLISVQELYRPVLKIDEKKLPPVPVKDSPDYVWWQEQIRRCLKGWIAPNGVYLNGYLYFYLNFCKIPLLNEQKQTIWENPKYRDNDHDILDILWQNTFKVLPNGRKLNAKNHIEGKPRGVAWSTFTLLGVAMWNFVFRSDREIGCAYPKDEIMKKEQEWFVKGWEALHPIFKTHKGRELIPLHNNKDIFQVGYKKSAKIEHAVTAVRWNVIGQETNAGVYKGSRMNLMIAAEAGLWVGNSLINYLTENEPSLKLGDTQWGMCIIGGTSNMIINKSSTAYKNMFVKHEAYNATRHFTSKTKVLQDYVDYHTGRSMEEEALVSINKLRESKVDDPIAYQQEIMENPLIWEEAFMASDQMSVYNTAVINEQLTKVRIEGLDQYWVRGKLEYIPDRYNKPTKNVMFKQDDEGIREEDKGDWYINLEGKPNQMYKNLHVAGIDDRYKTRREDKKIKASDSRNAMVIWRKPTSYEIKNDMPCAVYYGNDADMVIAYEEFLKGMLFYDVSKTMYEYNAEGFIMFMREKKELNRLYWNPETKEWGIKLSGLQIKQELTYLGTQFLKDNRQKNITLPMILESFLVWGGGNTDIGSALHCVFKMLELTDDEYVTRISRDKKEETSSIIKLGKIDHFREAINSTVKRIKLGMRVH